MIQQISPKMFPKNNHLQTILPSFLPVKMQGNGTIFQKKIISTEDGAELFVYSHIQKESPEIRNDILLIHGLEGSVDSNYIIRIANYALEKKFNVHRLNLRGCGESLSYNPMPYHAGLWQDVAKVSETIKVGSKLFLVGFSLGGNLVLKMAGELSNHMPPYISGIVAISGAIDMAAATTWLDSHSPLYQRYLLWYLMQSYKKRCIIFPQIYQKLLKHKPRNLFDFDDQVTGRLYGFQGASDYYSKAASSSILHKICIPTLLLYAKDDPMVPYAPYQTHMHLFQKSPYLHYVETQHGGHVGFMGPRWGEFCFHDIVWDFVQKY